MWDLWQHKNQNKLSQCWSIISIRRTLHIFSISTDQSPDWFRNVVVLKSQKCCSADISDLECWSSKATTVCSFKTHQCWCLVQRCCSADNYFHECWIWLPELDCKWETLKCLNGLIALVKIHGVINHTHASAQNLDTPEISDCLRIWHLFCWFSQVTGRLRWLSVPQWKSWVIGWPLSNLNAKSGKLSVPFGKWIDTAKLLHSSISIRSLSFAGVSPHSPDSSQPDLLPHGTNSSFPNFLPHSTNSSWLDLLPHSTNSSFPNVLHRITNSSKPYPSPHGTNSKGHDLFPQCTNSS